MGTVGAISEAVGLALKLINNHIEDPARRDRAIREYIDGLYQLAGKLIEAKDAEEAHFIIRAIIDNKP